jgi:hypothetical protein
MVCKKFCVHGLEKRNPSFDSKCATAVIEHNNARVGIHIDRLEHEEEG